MLKGIAFQFCHLKTWSPWCKCSRLLHLQSFGIIVNAPYLIHSEFCFHSQHFVYNSLSFCPKRFGTNDTCVYTPHCVLMFITNKCTCVVHPCLVFNRRNCLLHRNYNEGNNVYLCKVAHHSVTSLLALQRVQSILICFIRLITRIAVRNLLEWMNKQQIVRFNRMQQLIRFISTNTLTSSAHRFDNAYCPSSYYQGICIYLH